MIIKFCGHEKVKLYMFEIFKINNFLGLIFGGNIFKKLGL